jgi:release factor glutamine methyltransferase
VATIGEVLDSATERLRAAGVASPRFDAETLLGRLLDRDRGGLLLRRLEPLAPDAAARFADAIERRERREPLQHITGVQEFHGLEFKIDARALLPRPETEDVVDAALELGGGAARVTDLGTGSGCIAIALAVRRAGMRIHALDDDAQALSLARENARAHGVEPRIEFALGTFTDLPLSWSGMDVVVANPPYVTEREWDGLEPEVREHDPRGALVSGPTGLEAHRAVGLAAARLLRPGGLLILEIGAGQALTVEALLADAGFEKIVARPDLRGIARVVVAHRRGDAR